MFETMTQFWEWYLFTLVYGFTVYIRAYHIGKKGGMGPNLYGIFNSPAGQVEGYRYSEYLKESGIIWTREALHAWLSDRKTRQEYFGKEVKDTKMMWTGIKKEEKMQEILDYLESKELVH